MEKLLMGAHVGISVVLVILILLQQGKGSEMGASFGGGSSHSLFGSKGAGSFLVKVTAFLAGLFFLTSLGLGYLINLRKKLAEKPILEQNDSELSPRKINLPKVEDELIDSELE